MTVSNLFCNACSFEIRQMIQTELANIGEHCQLSGVKSHPKVVFRLVHDGHNDESTTVRDLKNIAGIMASVAHSKC